MALARQQQCPAMGGPVGRIHRGGIRRAGIRARRQLTSLGLDRGTRPPTAPLDGRHAVPLRLPRPGVVSAHRGCPRGAKVQSPARPGAGHRRTSRPHFPLAGPAQPGTFPAPRSVDPLHESEGHRGRPDPRRTTERARAPVSQLAAAAALYRIYRGALCGHECHLARPDRPNPEHFQHLDQSIRYMNQKGIVADLILAGPQNELAHLFPNWQQRRRYIGYIAAAAANMNVTWQGVQAFETYDTGRALMKEIGGLLKQMDPYQHPRTSGNLATSGALMDDGWMDFVAHHTGDDQVC